MFYEVFIPVLIVFGFAFVVSFVNIYREERRVWKKRLAIFNQVAKRNKCPRCSGELEYYGPDGERTAVCENYQNTDYQCRYISKEKNHTIVSQIYFIENPWKII